ncbi:MAG: tyrosine-type recombinase/integrase [Clostridia bacterium]|nr:tyrosine-type recombinase/integrase [Clostridia bacterium]
MILIQQCLVEFKKHLISLECSQHTVDKYLRDIRRLAEIVGNELSQMEQLLSFKQELHKRGYAVRSINSILSAVNHFTRVFGHPEWKLRFLKVQRSTFANGQKEIARRDYERLVKTAEERGDERLSLLLQTLCATGIRVSELRAITVESLRTGMVEIYSKAKIRVILIPRSLCVKLQAYCASRRIGAGCVFITRKGKPLDRSSIWKQMKRLSKQAKVTAGKVFPHNLRHLFARCFYQRYKDIVRLADILGHSSMDTTRIYTIQSSLSERRRLEQLGLVT